VVLGPQIDARLDAELHVARGQQREERLIGQEDLVDEVDVARALRDEPVELCLDGGERPPPVAIAVGRLRAEGAGEGAAARGLELGARAVRLGVEAVVVVIVARDLLVAPGQRGQRAQIRRGLARRGREPGRRGPQTTDGSVGHAARGVEASVAIASSHRRR
jgi:hypothetical protein